MEKFLSISLLLILPAVFYFAVSYFIALSKFKEKVVDELPEIWARARSNARALESWMPAAYTLLQKSNENSLEGHQFSSSLAAIRKRASTFLYITACLFMLLLVVVLWLDAITD